jgi:ubiquinol-cytochrome c reductase cytochrome b subunit
LFELRRYFTGKSEFIATLVIPTGVLAALMATPFLDRFKSSRVSSTCRIMVVSACVAGWGWLTLESYRQDWRDTAYLADNAEFENLSSRALALARTEPISHEGAGELLRHDPQTQGPRLFARHCVSCHSHVDSEGMGLVAIDASAPNLYRVGTIDWITGFLTPERVVSKDYFGGTSFREGEMVQHIQNLFSGSAADDGAVKREELHSIAVALATESGAESNDSELADKGRKAIAGSAGCTDCHRFHNQGEPGSAPDLTGYASVEWMKQMISKPSHERFYRESNDRMPGFATNSEQPELNLLSPVELELLVRWLRSPSSSAAAQRRSVSSHANPESNQPSMRTVSRSPLITP